MTRIEATNLLSQMRKDGEGFLSDNTIEAYDMAIKALKQESKIGHCKDCKYLEYDSVAIVHGIPLVIAHEICKRWSDGCKTNEDGYCFLFEPKKSEVSE